MTSLSASVRKRSPADRRTPQYVMMLDVDFWLCTDFRSRMLESPEIMQRLKGGMAAFVVPAFEFHKQADGVDPNTFPSTKEVRCVLEDVTGACWRTWLTSPRLGSRAGPLATRQR